MKFNGVTWDFDSLDQALGKMGRSIKPRLDYNYNTHILLVNMPSTIHEVPFQHIKDTITQSIAALPYDHDVITPVVQMNESITPDFCITITRGERPTQYIFLPVYGEVTCSETKDHTINKLKLMIATHFKLKMVIVILVVVQEVTTYNSPKRDSYTLKVLGKSNISRHAHPSRSQTITGAILQAWSTLFGCRELMGH
ncbi:hypothetical protein BDR07DRAFT_1382965 [Suillus spraguei]|nr:hypothetical protein BDR07DRAFT_1382965 [Suillus spraguei]